MKNHIIQDLIDVFGEDAILNLAECAQQPLLDFVKVARPLLRGWELYQIKNLRELMLTEFHGQ